MKRFDIINALIKKFNYKSYLEVGVLYKNECFDHIICDEKHTMDPFPKFDDCTYKATSDQGFLLIQYIGKKYDIIFIDGYHQELQVDRDIANALKVLNMNGTIVLHDCNPPDYYHQGDYIYSGNEVMMLNPYLPLRCGTVYKSIVKFNKNNFNSVYVVDTDYGCGVITKTKEKYNIDYEPSDITYDEFKNSRYLINLISVENFIEKMK